MDLISHKAEFDKIVKKYKLFDENKAQEIAKFLTKKEKVSIKEFASLFLMNEKEARIFLNFIQKGIEFKKDYVDKK